MMPHLTSRAQNTTALKNIFRTRYLGHTHTGDSPEGGPEEQPLMGTEEVTRNLRVCQKHLEKTRQALGTVHLCPEDSASCAWGGCGQARLSAHRRLQPDSCKDTAHLFSTRPFPCGLPGWAGQTFCFSGVPDQHVKNASFSHLSVLTASSLCLPSSERKSGAERPSSMNLSPQPQQTRTDHTQGTMQTGDELSCRMRKSSGLRGLGRLGNKTPSSCTAFGDVSVHESPCTRWLSRHLQTENCQTRVISGMTPVPPSPVLRRRLRSQGVRLV